MKEGKGKKTSQLSHARAQTNNLALTELMYEEILKTIQLMIKDGLLRNDDNRPLTELLDAHQKLTDSRSSFKLHGRLRTRSTVRGKRKVPRCCSGKKQLSCSMQRTCWPAQPRISKSKQVSMLS